VHTAGAFGEDDKMVTDREQIEAVMPVGDDGTFTEPVTDYAGQLVFDANAPIIADLKAATKEPRTAGAQSSVTPGTVLLRHETYVHSYPPRRRCNHPLIYTGVSAWFVSVSQVRAPRVELNGKIPWVPDHIKHGQFGKWLEGAR